MKKSKALVIASVAILMLTLVTMPLLAACAQPAPAPAPTPVPPLAPPSAPGKFEWNLASSMASGTMDYDILNEALAWLETVTSGRLKITQLPTGAIVKGPDQLQALSSGTVQVCRESPAYFTGTDPAFAILGSGPGVWESPIDLQLYFEEFGGKELARKLYGEHNVYYVGPTMSNSEPMHGNKPIDSFDALKGLKIRTLPGLCHELFKGIGAIPTTLDGSEIYSGLDTGVIDAAEFLSIATNYDLDFHEVSKYVLYPSFHRAAGADDISVNMDAWNELPDDLKLAMEGMVYLFSRWAWARQEAASYEALVKMIDYGVEHVTWTPADVARARAIGMNNLKEWGAKSPLAQEIADKIVAFFAATGRTL